MLVDYLFKPRSRVNQEHKSKYIFLLAYAASVHETFKNNVRRSLNKDELKPTIQAVEKVHNVCSSNNGSNELISEAASLYQCVR